MEARDWDQRYQGTPLLWTDRANQLLVEEVSGLPPGRALDLGSGEGRNAIWLAEQGWHVTAVDFSSVALERARALAGRKGVQLDLVHADLNQYTPAAATFDLITVLYLHVAPEVRGRVLRKAAPALRPGGRLVVIGHDVENLAFGHGGPQDSSILYTPSRIGADLPGLTLVRSQTVKRPVAAGQGTAAALDTLVVAIQPGAATLGTVTARWSGTPYEFEIRSPRGQVAIVDEPPPQGQDRGMRPTEMLLGSLATCSAISAVALLQKMRQPLRSLLVRVDATQQPDWPRAFTDIHLQFVVGGDGAFDPALVQKAIDLATTRYCPVHATIELGQGGARIDTGFTLVQDTPAGPE